MEHSGLLLILLVGIQTHSVVVSRPSVPGKESPSDTTYQEVDDFLAFYGYYPSTADLPAQVRNPSLRKHSDTERTKALKLFQQIYNLPQSGEIDKETTQLMQSPRCGNPDIISYPSTMETHTGIEMEDEDENDQKNVENKTQARDNPGVKVDRERRSSELSTKEKKKRAKYLVFSKIMTDRDGNKYVWMQREMKYFFVKFPNQVLPNKDQRFFIQAALFQWGPFVPFLFVEETKLLDAKYAHMKIWFHEFNDGPYFGNPWHKGRLWVEKKGSKKRRSPGKPKRTKRKGERLAHTSLPTYLSDRKYLWSRDIHFAENHKWVYPELTSVALHEIGHAVGLGHSNNPNAVMYPYNRNVTTFAVDDLEGIAELYGYQNAYFRSHLCTLRIKSVDAMIPDPKGNIEWNQEYYLFSGNTLRRLVTSAMSLSEKILIDDVFPGAPAKYDVVFSDSASNSVFFIKDQILYQYKNSKPMPPQRISLPETPTYALNFDLATGKGKERMTYIYGKVYSWRFVIDGDTVQKPNPKALSDDASKLLVNTKFAVQWIDGLVYAVKQNTSYVVLDIEFGKWNPYGKQDFFTVKNDELDWMRAMLCVGGHATCLRVPVPSLVLAILLSLIKLY